jgi:ketosteroid isomerase-like protein
MTTSASVAESNKAVILAFFEAGSRGDLDRVQELMADDLVIHQPAYLPYGGSYRKSQFPQLAATMSRYIVMRSARVVNLIAEGEYVFVVLAVPDARTGHECTQGVQIRLRDGQLVENHVFFHDAGSMARPAA